MELLLKKIPTEESSEKLSVKDKNLLFTQIFQYAGIGTESEKLGIERIAFLLASPEKGLVRLNQYFSVLLGRIYNTTKNTRANHWELLSIDVFSAMICKAIYTNPEIEKMSEEYNIADILFNELVQAGVYDAKKEYVPSINSFVKYINGLLAWKPSALTVSSFSVYNSQYTITAEQIYKNYGYNKVEGTHPGITEWLAEILKTISLGRFYEIEDVLKNMFTGLKTLIANTSIEVKKHEVEDKKKEIVSAKENNLAIQDKDVKPIQSASEIKWIFGKHDLSEVPEPFYQAACHMQHLCVSSVSKNGKDFIFNEPACDLFYDKDVQEVGSNEIVQAKYDSDVMPNFLAYGTNISREKNKKSVMGMRRFKAEDRKQDGFIYREGSVRACSGKTQQQCYVARNCVLCPCIVASYIHYLRKTDPEEEKRQREECAKKGNSVYKNLEPLLFKFHEDFIEKIKISSESLRFAKKILDTGAVLPHVVFFSERNDKLKVTVSYPQCFSNMFSDEHKSRFSVKEIDAICEGETLFPYKVAHTMLIPSHIDEREKFFLETFNGQSTDNIRIMFCLLLFVYGLLQQNDYDAYIAKREEEEKSALGEVQKVFSFGEDICGFYGSIVGSDAKAVKEKALLLVKALQAKCSYLYPSPAQMSITDFMESLVEEAKDGFSDTTGMHFKEPESNMIYILDGLGFWLQYYDKYTKDLEYTHNRARMLQHCLKMLLDYRPDNYIILTGNKQEMDKFIETNKVFKTLFAEHQIVIPDDGPEELYQKFVKLMGDKEYNIKKKEFIDYVSRNMGYFPFKNDSLACYLSDHVKATQKLPADFNTRNKKSVEKSLDEMVGMANIKSQIARFNKYVQFVQQAKEFKMEIPASNYHMLFMGNPGTGKTTVARIIAKVLYDCCVCKKDKFTEIQGTDLVAKYLGQTASKTKGIIEDALDGVLFIDEAYAITDGRDGTGANDYGKEAISVLIKMMEDHKDRLVVIFAGYKEKMERFVKANEGMQSRIGYTFNFEDYNDKELLEIFCKKAKKASLVLGKGVKEKVETIIKDVPKGKNFGNGRFIDKLLQEVLIQHAMNLSDIEKMKKLSVKDIPEKELIFEKAFGSNKKMTLYDKTEIGFMAESKNKTAMSDKK